MEGRVYSRTAITLHWLIAGLLAFQIGMGFGFEDQERGPGLFAAYQLHKSLGILILVLSLLRLVLRVGRRNSKTQPGNDQRVDNRLASGLARFVHAAFYGYMILAPLTGWIIVSTAKIQIPTRLFGVIPWPHLPVPPSWHAEAEYSHGLMSWVAIGLFVLHVAGALRHHILHRDGTLQRMIPLNVWSLPRGFLVVVIAVAALVSVGFLAHSLRLSALGTPRLLAENARMASTTPLNVEPPATIVEAAPKQKPLSKAAPQDKVGALGSPSKWKIMPPKHLSFVARWNETAVKGSFSRWTGDIKFDPNSLAASSIRIKIKLASAVTGDAQYDGMLLGEFFFNTAANPDAEFVSDIITARGGDRYRIAGKLKLNGNSRAVIIDATVKINGNSAKVEGSTTIDRTAFGVGSGEWATTDQIAGPVSVTFDFVATRP